MFCGWSFHFPHIWRWSHLSVLVFLCFWCHIQEILPNPKSQRCNYSLQPHGLQPARIPCPSPTPRACSDSCPSSWWCHMSVCLALIFRYLIHLESVFGWGVRYGSNCILLCVETYLSQHSLFKKAISPPLNCLGMFVKNQFTINVSVEFGTLNSIPLIFCISLCQYYIDWIMVALQQNLKLGNVSLPNLFFFFKIILAISLLHF